MSKRVVFVANNTEFFFRHFRTALEAAIELGFQAVLFLPTVPPFSINDPRATSLVSPLSRRRSSIPTILFQMVWFIAQLRQQRPDVIVAYSLRSCLVTALAVPFTRRTRIVLAVTGLGLMELLPGLAAECRRRLVYAVLHLAGRSRRVFFLFENHSDEKTIGFSSARPAKARILMGAGVDPSEYIVQPLPPRQPLKLATASRLVWSKGIDVAVAAVSSLAAQGLAVELSIFGTPDIENPKSFSESAISEWTKQPGIIYRGFSNEMPQVWAQHHAALFPSRGGEGLPRALLEAAAAGRPCLVSNVPDCSDFVRDGIEGFVVPAGSVDALKVAIMTLVNQPERIEALGRAARQRLVETGTSEIIRNEYGRLFRELMPVAADERGESQSSVAA